MHSRNEQFSPRRLAPALALLALAAALVGGCADEPEREAVSDAQASSFEVTTSIEIDQSNFRDAVRVDTVILGIGSVLLEPLDDLDAPLLSNRSPTALRYDLDGAADGRAETPPMTLDRPGRYLLSLAIQPVDAELWTTGARIDAAMREDDSVLIQGHYFVVAPPSPSSPEPVPLRERMKMLSSDYDMFDAGRVHDYPFTYSSSRTGYIRVGEIELSPDQNHIEIRIDLEGWLNEALAPVLAEAVRSPSNVGATSLDVSTRLDGSGQGLEQLFNFSVAESF